MNRRGKIGFLVLFSLITLFFSDGLRFNYPQSLAATQNELKQRIEERNKEIQKLEEEIKQYQTSLEATSDAASSLKGEISRINGQIKNLNSQIFLAQKQISKKELEIGGLEQDISDTSLQLDERQETLKKILRKLNETESESTMEVLLKYRNISDFFGVLESFKILNDNIKNNFETLTVLKTDFEEKKTEAETAQKKLASYKVELADTRMIEEQGRAVKDNLLKATKNQEAQYQKLLKDRAAQRDAILKEIQDTEDELRKLIDPNKIPEGRPGVLAWPIEGAVLTQSFGATPESKILYNGKPHNGIDIKAKTGTPVKAAEDGIVLNTGNTDAYPRCLSYGKWILIKHPNNLATLYAHLSLIKVNTGDMVSRGDLIAYSGSTGYATGPHLHFTVYDASTVEFKASGLANSTCKLLPFGGYLNPLAYL
ncbi:peptidoglycan DD-metalloendopeptidase family protein [Candidatus Giovannonibacteria bacterium]|nr:peptidoglycan DD-metalloendopeptidase family protein [Candidatus Giovannonibacteria bacterium]